MQNIVAIEIFIFTHLPLSVLYTLKAKLVR